MDYANPIVIDFETYYDDEYSLKKMTTEAYIRDPRFECMGLSIKDGNKGTKFYREEQGIELVRQLIRQTERPVVAHNARFDGGILALRYGIHPKGYIDTKPLMTVAHFAPFAGGDSLAKAAVALQKAGHSIQNKGEFLSNMIGVHAADMSEQDWLDYGNYCIGDVDICHKLYMVLYPIVPEAELRMMDVTTRMYTNPLFEFDVEILKDYYKRLETQRVDNLTFFTDHFGFNSITETETALRSRKKFPELLESLGVPCPMKWSEKQEKHVPALAKTDEALTTLLEHHNPIVADLVSTKLGVNQTLALSRCRQFLEIGLRGNLPVPLNYAKAHTGRYGGADSINVQNLPKRSGDTTLRRSIIAPRDHVVIASDSSQVEARCLVYMANEQRVVDIFISGECPYSDMAASIYDMTYGRIYHDAKIVPTKEGVTRRNVGKTTILGCIAEGMEVLTDSGWKAIEAITDSDLLWDGEEYVSHGGLIDKGNKPCLEFNGVLMTPDHRVFDGDKWEECWRASAVWTVIFAHANLPLGIHSNIDTYNVGMRGDKLVTHKTYDILNVGKHNRFFVRGAEGQVTCVHNCGYQMGANAFAEQLRIAGLDSVMDMAPEIVKTYRATNPNVKAFWATCETAIKVMIAGGDMWFGGPNNDLFYASGTTNFWGIRTPSIRMPDGTYLKYHNLRTEPDPEAYGGYATVYEQYKYGNYVRNYLYGGKLAENITQSIAFAILKYQALIIDAAGVPVNLNVHDEWVSVVHKRDAKAAIRIHAHAMRQVPDYMPQGLLDCEVDMGKNYMDTTTIKGV